jgi:tRNA pseudouridine32 synthase/23S rRNA pseudouridine746 synthase/23S rRNA pseudouridine1911/1915/1917 synthase
MTDWNWVRLRRSSLIAEDDAILALNKPVGVSVMGERHDTDLSRLAEEAGERLFPVHRIDKVTSGVVLFAKDLAVHGGLTRQFNKQTVDKAYLVITRTGGLPPRGQVDLPLSAGRKGTVRIAAPREKIQFDAVAGRWWVAAPDLLDTRRYPSQTTFRTLWTDGEFSLLTVTPVTGRRHQIRVHLAWIGHPILGDPLFRSPADRTCLHSWRLGFAAAWLGGREVGVAAAPGPDFFAPLVGRLAPDAAARLLPPEAATRQLLTVTRAFAGSDGATSADAT